MGRVLPGSSNTTRIGFCRHPLSTGWGAGIGSIFRGIFRALLPIAKSAGRTFGKQALRTGAEIASDILAGENVKRAASKRARTAAATLLREAQQQIQEGDGLGRRVGETSIKGTATVPKNQSQRTKRTKVSDQLGVYYK